MRKFIVPPLLATCTILLLLIARETTGKSQYRPKGEKKTGHYEFSTTGTPPIPITQIGETDKLRLVQASGPSPADFIQESHFVFQNVSGREITAAVFIVQAMRGDESIFQQTEWFDAKIVPGLSPVRALGTTTAGFASSFQPPGAVTSIQILVDFVELADGSQSGKDSYRVSQRIADERRGARKAFDYLNMKLSALGLPAVGEILRESKTQRHK